MLRALRIKIENRGWGDRMVDWLGHSLDCRRYGQPPDAEK